MLNQLDQIKEILSKHIGKSNKITSSQIAKSLKIDEDDTHAKTRALILEAAEKHELPLAADTRGYYLIASNQEYDSYMHNLDNRIQGIKYRKELITKNYKRK